ncbi:MAG: tRNA (N6-threonylcarbamoyladenosine(37)-N6)-methyltransferase TrmO [Bacillota bacterium]|nr:tRNA (N6-threonylcarbamoyladenosine(37)-N6)-methyltransferase TrmO [Bacillota bacterium]MDI7250475.1 tRNA (N6-threonylcarbamoyladenosine(37)-N6)-methyltransferase TrmO [Bacillota bacterium]
MEFQVRPVGLIHTPFRQRGEAPRQGRFSREEALIEIFPAFAEGLLGVEHSRYLLVLYWCDRADRERLVTVTPHGPEPRGVFACRSPSRPNPIALCVAELVSREGNRLVVRGVDALDGSPLVDIKPYVPDLDCVPTDAPGWFRRAAAAETPAEASRQLEGGCAHG